MSPSSRQHVAISYIVLVLLVVLVTITVSVPAITARADSMTTIQTAKDVYRRSVDAIANAEMTLALEDWEIDITRLLQAETDALAAAQLQQTVSGIVGDDDAELISMAYRRSEEVLPLIEILVAVRLKTSVAVVGIERIIT